MNGRIDILMATCNGQHYLCEQLDSILNQSFRNWKLTIRDDASNDQTPQIIAAYAAQYPDQIQVMDRDRIRLGAAQNFHRLLAQSAADYVMFCDQDDVWLPQKIEKSMILMKETEDLFPGLPVLVHTDLKVVDHQLNTLAESMWSYQRTDPDTGVDPQQVMLKNIVTGCAMMINKACKPISMPIPVEAVMHDWWIALNVSRHGKIVYIPEPLVLHRQHEKNVMGADRKKRTSLKRRIMDHYQMVKKADPNINYFKVLVKKSVNRLVR